MLKISVFRMNLIKLFEKSFKENRALPALTDYLSGKTYSYLQLAAKVDNIHGLLRESGVIKGEKVALVGKNSIDWICTYISVLTYGATVVPILPDFNPLDMVGIINHSDSVILFADKSLLEKMSVSDMKNVRHIYCLEEMPAVPTDNFDIESICYADVDDEDPVIISYTSGTTGNSKGVTLPLRSLTDNVTFALLQNFHFKTSRVLALLPLAHAYGCAFDMLTPLSTGSHIFVLGKIPTPKILIDALGQVGPSLICTVPLVMEKIVHKNIMPRLEKGPVKFLLKIPVLKGMIYRKIRSQMLDTFGGNLIEVNMGGAALAPDVEDFLKRIKFPFTVGYGMTECGPIICYENWYRFKSGSCGRIVPYLDIRIDTEGYEDGTGEVCVKGSHVMLGYYKNPEATAAVLKDGWLHTGDIGYLGKDKTLYLRGRCKSMILTSAGQNIYPEEIEGKLNNLDGVAESLVYEQDGKLIALVVPDQEMIKNNDSEGIKAYMKGLLSKLNAIVAPFEKIAEIKACSEPFEKTPKQSIKRFLYPKKAKFL